jgi:Fe2+ or Zn2+ uptake regulation protein
MNYSRQREMILNILSASCSHPTAEEILEAVRKEDEHVARGTVYRNLGLLVESGDIIKITTPEGVCRYDYIHSSHSHAVCERCGRVIDFCFKDSGMGKYLTDEFGFVCGNSALSVRGLCRECLNKKVK